MNYKILNTRKSSKVTHKLIHIHTHTPDPLDGAAESVKGSSSVPERQKLNAAHIRQTSAEVILTVPHVLNS